MLVKVFLFVFISVTTLSMTAQTLAPTVISAGGGVDKTAGTQLQWTLGEPAVESLTGVERSYTEGFHQPSLEVQRIDPDLLIPIDADADFAIRVYPNPVAHNLTIDRGLVSDYEIEAVLHKMDGSPLITKSLAAGEGRSELELTGLAAGVYLLHFHSKQGEKIATYKISKIQ